MLSRPLAVALLAVACVGAAAGGAYLAARQGAEPALSASPAIPVPGHSQTAAAVKGAGAVAERPATASPETVERVQPAPQAARAERSPGLSPTPPPAPARAPRPVPAAAPPPSPVPSSAGTPVVSVEPLALPEREVPVATVRPAAPLPPMRLFEDLVVPASAVVGLQIETPVSSERARLEDRVEARVLRDVTVDGRTAIPAGSRALGVVTLVERGGKLKDRASLGVQFHALVLADGTRLPIRSEPIFREGDSPGAESSRKIGGAAAGGAILGAIIGGKKGAIVGGTTGAAGGTAVVMAGDRNAATLPVGAVVTVRLSEPLIVEVETR